IIDEDGNIFFAGGGSLVKLEIVRPSGQPAPIRVTPIPPLPEEEGLKQSVLYPNPSHDFIELPAHLADTGVKSYVTNTTGQILIESTDRKPYVGDLSPGVYLLKSGTSTIRFSKE
ncbi:MAG: T9SS type A sorting domain-containing protein, partial [Bacteroidota bacterium]